MYRLFLNSIYFNFKQIEPEISQIYIKDLHYQSHKLYLNDMNEWLTIDDILHLSLCTNLSDVLGDGSFAFVCGVSRRTDVSGSRITVCVVIAVLSVPFCFFIAPVSASAIDDSSLRRPHPII